MGYDKMKSHMRT